MRKPTQVAIYIYRTVNGAREYLLLKRIAEAGGFWQGVTGGVEDDETVLQTAIRELREETGFVDTVIVQIDYRRTFPVPASMQHYFSNNITNLTEHAFHTGVAPDVTPVIDSREHSEYLWVGYHQAVEMLKYPGNIEALTICEKELNAR